MVVVTTSRSPAGVVLLLAALLVAFTATGAAAESGNSSTICDTALCGKGTCSEVPGLIPLFTTSYKCTCDPGWSQPKLFNLTVLPFAPCIIPECTFDQSCYNFTFLSWPLRGIPLTDPCVIIDCGQGGECKKGVGFSYTCQCKPDYINFLNFTGFPCVRNCFFGDDCAKLGIDPHSAPPPMPSTAAPDLPGSVSPWRLLQHLLSQLAMLLLLHQAV